MQSPKTPDQQPFEYIKYAYIHVFNFKCVGFTSFKHTICICPYLISLLPHHHVTMCSKNIYYFI